MSLSDYRDEERPAWLDVGEAKYERQAAFILGAMVGLYTGAGLVLLIWLAR